MPDKSQPKLHNVCAIHLWVCSTLGMFSTPGDIMSTVGDIMSTVGDIMSTPRDVQYTGGTLLVHWRHTMMSVGIL